jgi:peptidoglycan/xylan/chitin deacetylase (PgdA/CDA1 family)
MGTPTVFMWHGFGEREDATDPYRLFLPGETFARQLDILAQRGSHFLDLEAYLAGLPNRRWPPRSVLITIDDGYVSTLTVAAPLLAARAVPAVMFALAGRVGGVSTWMPEMAPEPLLDADGLRQLGDYGIQVESHGWDHTLLPGLSPRQLHHQVVDARAALADTLRREPVAFAYPSGLHDAPARLAVESAGYTCAFAVHNGPSSRWALPRVDVNPTDTELTFRLKATALWTPAYRSIGRIGAIRRSVHQLTGSSR